MIQTTVTCDVCGIQKQDANHWYVAEPYVAQLNILTWTDTDARRAQCKHICGQQCAQKFLEQWMSK